jgi:hypothetical protein
LQRERFTPAVGIPFGAGQKKQPGHHTYQRRRRRIEMGKFRERCTSLARVLVLAGAAAISLCATALGQGSAPNAKDQPYVVEYYYKARWGYADEFIKLFKKNHLPVLKKQIETGRITKVSAVRPRLHATEEGRWDYRVTITFRNVGVTADGFDEQALARELYPDQELFRKEEQRRFEILIGHWDVPITDVDLEK